MMAWMIILSVCFSTFLDEPESDDNEKISSSIPKFLTGDLQNGMKCLEIWCLDLDFQTELDTRNFQFGSVCISTFNKFL